LICEKFATEGSNVAIKYVGSENRAYEMVEKCERCFGVKATAIKGVSENKRGPEHSCRITVTGTNTITKGHRNSRGLHMSRQ
jgi:hypothetical protein